MHSYSTKGFIFISLLAIQLLVGCTEPVFFNATERTDLSGWENTGSVNASFLASNRVFASTNNTGSPTFEVNYIATASNIDSLIWQFPGGTPASSTLVQEAVTYEGFGSFDVGLEVFNSEDVDRRYVEDYIRLFYQDDWSFSADSWTISGTTSASDYEPKTDADGNAVTSWIIVPYTVANQAECLKSFSSFPSNNLILEFDYNLEKIPVLYVASNYVVSRTTTIISSETTVTNTFTITNLNNPIEYVDQDTTPVPTTFISPSTYPGERRLILNYNGFPIWVTSKMTNGLFKRVKLSLPSLSNFELGFIKTQNALDASGVIDYPYQAEIKNLTIKLREEEQ